MMKRATTISLLVLAGIYLFVSAPPPLPEASGSAGSDAPPVPVRVLLDAANAANAAARKVYTERIVSAGQEAGLAFAEDWMRSEREAGPLPGNRRSLCSSARTSRSIRRTPSKASRCGPSRH